MGCEESLIQIPDTQASNLISKESSVVDSESAS